MKKIKVWDLPVRLFHWLIVGLVAFSWYMAEQGQLRLHMYSGTAILTLVIFRIIWGFFGSTTGRFSHFVKGPGAVMAYLRRLREKGDIHPVGHNPSGGWAVILMLLLLLTQAILGLFASEQDVFFFAPLSDLVSLETSHLLTELHETLFNVLLTVVILHIAAVLFYLLVKKTDLILPMITGKKAVSDPHPALKFISPLWALAITGVVFALIWFLIVAPAQ